ncbi:MAG: ABC transporter substrate-binding protein [Myxococcota bacterium]
MHDRPRLCPLWLALLGILLSIGCADDETLPEPIRIGVIVSLSGDLGSIGPHLQQSAELAAREINASGGLLDGRPIELVVEDDRTDATQARTVAERLVRDERVVAVVGSLASSASLEIQTVTGPAEVPQVSCCSTSEDLTTAQDAENRFLFRTVPSDILQAGIIARYARDNAMCTRLAVMHLDDSYGNPFGNAIRGNFETGGGTVVAQVAFPSGRPSYATEVQMAANATPDCIALVAFTESGGFVLRDWNALPTPPDVTWIGTDGMRDAGFVEAAGDPRIADGFVGTAPITAPATEQYNDYAGNFFATYGREAGIFGGNQYDATALLALAIERSSSTEGPAIRQALREVATPGAEAGEPFFGPAELGTALTALRSGRDVNYDGASGPVDFDASGNVVSNYEIWRYDANANAFTRDEVIQASTLTDS